MRLLNIGGRVINLDHIIYVIHADNEEPTVLFLGGIEWAVSRQQAYEIARAMSDSGLPAFSEA